MENTVFAAICGSHITLVPTHPNSKNDDIKSVEAEDISDIDFRA